VDEARLVDGFQTGQKLHRDLGRFSQLQRSTLQEDLAQARSVDVLHRDDLAVALLHQVEDPADVGRSDVAGGAHFAAQEFRARGIGEDFGQQELERHLHLELLVESLPHLAHAAPAQQILHAVTAALDHLGDCPTQVDRPFRLVGTCGFFRLPVIPAHLSLPFTDLINSFGPPVTARPDQ
jgi:hypothetical protein